MLISPPADCRWECGGAVGGQLWPGQGRILRQQNPGHQGGQEEQGQEGEACGGQQGGEGYCKGSIVEGQKRVSHS